MAEKRMFAKTIVDSDAFLDMPMSTQALYFHLGMRADDDGFVNSPKKIQKIVGAADDDMKLLIAKKFIIAFESGIIVIKHWRLHNCIQKDRYTPTKYIDERATLSLDENKAYTNHHVYTLDTQNRLGKDSIDKNSIDDIDIPELPPPSAKPKKEQERNHRSIPPTVDEVKTYCLERKNRIDAEYFVDYYTVKDWKVGKEKMKDWQAAVRTWEKREEQKPQTSTAAAFDRAAKKQSEEEYF